LTDAFSGPPAPPPSDHSIPKTTFFFSYRACPDIDFFSRFSLGATVDRETSVTAGTGRFCHNDVFWLLDGRAVSFFLKGTIAAT